MGELISFYAAAARLGQPLSVARRLLAVDAGLAATDPPYPAPDSLTAPALEFIRSTLERGELGGIPPAGHLRAIEALHLGHRPYRDYVADELCAAVGRLQVLGVSTAGDVLCLGDPAELGLTPARRAWRAREPELIAIYLFTDEDAVDRSRALLSACANRTLHDVASVDLALGQPIGRVLLVRTTRGLLHPLLDPEFVALADAELGLSVFGAPTCESTPAVAAAVAGNLAGRLETRYAEILRDATSDLERAPEPA